jgi:putative oxidoreductase
MSWHRTLLDWRGHAVLALPARLYLGWVFLAACWHKILDPAGFGLDIATYQLLPTELINPMAITLPWIELVAGAALVIGLRTRPAALLIAGMMVMFIIAISLALHQGLEMGCGCFASSGLEEDPISMMTVLRDLGWLALALYVLGFDRRPLGLDRLLEKRTNRSAAPAGGAE